MSPSLKRITPTAPAATAFCSFSVNPQVPRWISDTAPLVAAGKSDSSQPLVVPPGLGIDDVVGGHDPDAGERRVGECSKAMKSTAGESSSAALPGVYVLLHGDVSCRTGAAVSCQIGMLNIS